MHHATGRWLLTVVRSLRSLISNSHKSRSFPSKLLHSSIHLSIWKFLCNILLLSALLPSSGRDGVFHLLSFFFLLDSIPLSPLNFISGHLINQLIFSSIPPPPNTLTLSLHPHLLWKTYPATDPWPLISEMVFTKNYITHFGFCVKVLLL